MTQLISLGWQNLSQCWMGGLFFRGFGGTLLLPSSCCWQNAVPRCCRSEIPASSPTAIWGCLSLERPLSSPSHGPSRLRHVKSISCLEFLWIPLLWHLLPSWGESSLLLRVCELDWAHPENPKYFHWFKVCNPKYIEKAPLSCDLTYLQKPGFRAWIPLGDHFACHRYCCRLVTKSCLTFATPRTVAHQAAVSMGFLRHGYWSGLPFPSPGDLPNPGIEPVCPALTGRFFPTEPPGKPLLAAWEITDAITDAFLLAICVALRLAVLPVIPSPLVVSHLNVRGAVSPGLPRARSSCGSPWGAVPLSRPGLLLSRIHILRGKLECAVPQPLSCSIQSLASTKHRWRWRFLPTAFPLGIVLLQMCAPLAAGGCPAVRPCLHHVTLHRWPLVFLVSFGCQDTFFFSWVSSFSQFILVYFPCFFSVCPFISSECCLCPFCFVFLYLGSLYTPSGELEPFHIVEYRIYSDTLLCL